MKSRLALCVAVFGLAIASAKSYSISLSQAAKAGGVDLEPGRYEVTVDGAKARFKNSKTGKTVEATAKVTSVEKKFKDTQVISKEAEGARQIREIGLGGTTTKVEFETGAALPAGAQE